MANVVCIICMRFEELTYVRLVAEIRKTCKWTQTITHICWFLNMLKVAVKIGIH